MDPVTLHLHGQLAALCREADEDGHVAVPVSEPRSAKDAFESVGIPHTEVGHLVVDGDPADHDHLVRGGETVTLHDVQDGPRPDSLVAPPPPPRPVTVVADVHLGTLARRLRLLGVDTWWRNDAADPLLARVAADQRRVLLTRDRRLLMRRAIVHGVLVRHDDPTAQLAQVVGRLALAGQLAPRTRCVRCNGTIVAVSRADVADELEPGTLAADHDQFGRCTNCGNVYWPGAHDDDLRAIIERAAP